MIDIHKKLTKEEIIEIAETTDRLCYLKDDEETIRVEKEWKQVLFYTTGLHVEDAKRIDIGATLRELMEELAKFFVSNGVKRGKQLAQKEFKDVLGLK